MKKRWPSDAHSVMLTASLAHFPELSDRCALNALLPSGSPPVRAIFALGNLCEITKIKCKYFLSTPKLPQEDKYVQLGFARTIANSAIPNC